MAHTSFLSLPPELHGLVASQLPYPDALSLKHTCTYFYNLTETDVHMRVGWLLERHERHLECLKSSCSFKTDESFCTKEVSNLMAKRRRHEECNGSCTVLDGRTCDWRRVSGLDKTLSQWLAMSGLQKGDCQLALVVALAGLLFWKLMVGIH